MFEVMVDFAIKVRDEAIQSLNDHVEDASG